MSTKKWHDQLVPVGKVDLESKRLVDRRDTIVYRIGDYVWYNFKGKKSEARLKKREGEKWRINFRWSDGKIYIKIVTEDEIEPNPKGAPKIPPKVTSRAARLAARNKARS